MDEYLKAQKRTNEEILNHKINKDELNRFSKADFRWADNKSKQLKRRTIKKGEVYQFEFGKNYLPEMSYEHRGLVIGQKQKLLYVLPICSYNPVKHLDVYHPTDNPESTSNYFLLKSNEFDFIDHDSILKLNDIRTVSINRILYNQNGRIDPSSDIYKQIEEMVIHKSFTEFYYNYNHNLKMMDSLNNELNGLQNAYDKLKEEKQELELKIIELQEMIKNCQDSNQ